MGDTGLTVEDRVELTTLVTEVAWRIDHGEADKVYELFTEDGTMALGPDTFRGRDELIAWGKARSAQRTTRHMCTNLRFVATGPDTVAGTIGATVFFHEGEGLGSTTPMAAGEYTDEYVRGPDGWRVRSRVMNVLFVRPAG